MMKKNELIEILNNGGHVALSDIYRTANVYDADGSRLDTCRYDTAERIGSTEGYKTERGEAWSFTRYIKRDPRHDDGNQYGLAACIESLEFDRDFLKHDAAEIAAHLLHSQDVNGCLFNRTMWDAFAVLFPDFPVSYEVMREIYAAQPGDVDHAARGIREYAQTIEDERAQDQLEQQLQDQLDQLDQLEQQLQEVEEKLQQLQELQQEQEQQLERATYTNLSSGQESTSAAEAMQWHRAGDRVRVERGGRAVDITGAAQQPAQDENRNHCRYIAHELEKYARGDVYRCPECGELLELPDDVGEKYRCPHCETVHELEQLEQLSLYDYFEDCLDIEYRIGGDREYRSVRVMVACGGPNIFIDTETRAVELYWWGSNARYLIDTDACEQVDEWAEELFTL